MPIDLVPLLQAHKRERSSLIFILQEVQDRLGYLPEEVVGQIARHLGLSPNEVFGVLTFYAQFRLTPSGRNLVRVCRGTACHVRGGVQVLKEVEKRLGIRDGETSRDMEYTLETVACIGACSLAPTMVINGETHGQMAPRRVAELFPDKTPPE